MNRFCLIFFCLFLSSPLFSFEDIGSSSRGYIRETLLPPVAPGYFAGGKMPVGTGIVEYNLEMPEGFFSEALASLLRETKRESRFALSFKGANEGGTIPYSRIFLYKTPVKITGIANVISLICRNRGAPVILKLILKDIRGILYKIPVSVKSDYQWSYFRTAIPGFIKQVDFFVNTRQGMSLMGVEIRCPGGEMDIEVDIISAVSDHFLVENRDPGEMKGGW